MTVLAPDDAARWLRAHRHGTSADEALAFVDRLPAVGVDELRGRWHGSGWHTGHGWDGLLEAYGWYGKEFDDADHVRPLLFRDRSGDPVPVRPLPAPVAVLRARPGLARGPLPRTGFRMLLPLLASSRPAGRLRAVEHRGTVTAALVYDDVPIVDAFRRVTPDLVVGAADIRGQSGSLLFVLRRAGAGHG
ncbi:GXWXG domain-containing protein [Cellulomonas sp. ATA003]|uniref:GXWXG domain-containing protein n=1 Tax=Cellulomonas sp. ATA003 TaxID=3073064 RepID=UPI002872D179|nr:GXWXG domain-containing protein [Cellulomonas sp. ATA003]WNB86663.1 GXWXG domain-containing protein [Cellulomonas sp. ATA003]